MSAIKKPFIITIDGPAGSGKSTVSLRIAGRLGLNCLTTGSFYRGLAAVCKHKGIDVTDEAAVLRASDDPSWKVMASPRGTVVLLENRDISAELNSEALAKMASQVAAHQKVREKLLSPQRAFDRGPGLVAEGRDCGTKVFPHAQVKVFLTASLDTRTSRRSQEDVLSGADVLKRLAKRDQADSQRKASPMAMAADAVEIDTSSLSIDEVVEKVMALIIEKGWSKT